MLKKKQEVNYRRGRTWASCSGCDHFVREFSVVGIGGAVLGVEPRCRVIGLEPGRMYRINPNHWCDRYDNTMTLARIKGEPVPPAAGCLCGACGGPCGDGESVCGRCEAGFMGEAL